MAGFAARTKWLASEISWSPASQSGYIRLARSAMTTNAAAVTKSMSAWPMSIDESRMPGPNIQ